MLHTKLTQLKTKTTNEEGFTLIELMIVVVIIGVLAAIAIPIFSNQQKAAIKAGMKSDVRALQTAVATYLVKNPTATNLQWRFENGAQFNNKALNDDPNWTSLVQNFKTSDPATIMIIRDAVYVDSNPPATWQNYYVIAANWTVKEGPSNHYYYWFNAATGKYGESG